MTKWLLLPNIVFFDVKMMNIEDKEILELYRSINWNGVVFYWKVDLDNSQKICMIKYCDKNV